MQRRFPIVDILFRSGDIRDRSAKSSEIAPKARFSAPNFFLGGGPQIFKTAPISDHVAKFRGGRPRDRGDLALNKKRKKEKKETAAKHKGSRVALSQRAALTRRTTTTRVTHGTCLPDPRTLRISANPKTHRGRGWVRVRMATPPVVGL